jgi:hypothetical protein
MAKIYLINVGANTSHSSKARAPLFPDGDFVFIPFPDEDSSASYDQAGWSFVSDPNALRTHPDPDWQNLTYGDNCHNRRAKALLSVKQDDILLFWALFWKVARNAKIFRVEACDRRWCLFGAITIIHTVEAERDRDVTVSEIIKDKATLNRAIKNSHVRNGKLPRISSNRHDMLLIGDPARSACFTRALDLQVHTNGGLLQKTFLSKDQRPLRWDTSPRWNSSLRTCRPVLDLCQDRDLARAQRLRAAILAANPDFDLLASADARP